MHDIWSSLKETFDASLPRMTAICLKEDDYDLGYYCPSPDNRIGYHYLDTNLSIYNQDRYTFELYFAAYEYPNLCKGPGKTRFLFEEQSYFPGQIGHTFHFPNSALAGREKFSAAIDGGLTWSFDLTNTSVGLPDPTHIYRYSKKLYTIFRCHDGFTAAQDAEGVIEITLQNHRYFIASSIPMKIAVFASEMDAYESMGDSFAAASGHGRVLAIEQELTIDTDETVPLTFGMSHHSREQAINALAVKDPDSLLKEKWNTWFASLPTVGFDTACEEEKKLYYKCWWTIRLDYCDYPGWGFNVLESLPVYKGIWTWAINAVEWHSSQDPEHPSEWIRKGMDILLNAQRDDGYITHAAYLHEKNPGESWMQSSTIQNPHFPWAALRHYNASGDLESLKRWYPKLEKFYHYMNRDFDECHRSLHLWAMHWSFDTGLDTFPTFQECTYGIDGKEPTEYCYGAVLAAERYRYECTMAELAELTDLGDKSAWLCEAEKTLAATNKYLWDEEKHWYGAIQVDGRLDTRVGLDGLFPMLYGMTDPEKLSAAEPQFARLIGKYGIHTCAPDEPGFFSDIYWRGPCWPKSASVATSVAEKYYPHLLDAVAASTRRAFLAYPNIWECIDPISGKLARGNTGFYCTACMSSNVGAGELIGAIWESHGMDMFGITPTLPLIPMTNYHHKGLRITVAQSSAGYTVSATAAEVNEADVTFHCTDGRKITCRLTAGITVQI